MRWEDRNRRGNVPICEICEIFEVIEAVVLGGFGFSNSNVAGRKAGWKID